MTGVEEKKKEGKHNETKKYKGAVKQQTNEQQYKNKEREMKIMKNIMGTEERDMKRHRRTEERSMNGRKDNCVNGEEESCMQAFLKEYYVRKWLLILKHRRTQKEEEGKQTIN